MHSNRYWTAKLENHTPYTTHQTILSILSSKQQHYHSVQQMHTYVHVHGSRFWLATISLYNTEHMRFCSMPRNYSTTVVYTCIPTKVCTVIIPWLLPFNFSKSSMSSATVVQNLSSLIYVLQSCAPWKQTDFPNGGC